MADPISAAATAFAAFATGSTTASVAASIAAGTASWATLTAYVVGYATITAGISMGLSAVARAQLPDPEGQKIPRRQSRPVRVAAVGGPSRMSGAFMLRESVGNRYGAVLAVADGPFHGADGYPKVYVHDDLVTRNGAGWVQGMAGERYGTGDLLRIQTRKGLPTETHYGMLTPDFGGYWPTTARGDGVLSVGIWAQHRSRESFARHFPNGEPMVSIVDIPLVCDWRAGGDPDDPATWGISWNPIVWLVHVEVQRHGRSWARSIAPVLDALTAEADYCDEVVTRNGVEEYRYRCAGNYPVNTQPQTVRESLLATCDGWMCLDGQGRLVVKAGRYDEPTVTLTAEHIIGYSWRSFQTDEEAVNALVVSFVDPAADYTEVEAGTLRDEADIAARGVERSEPLQLLWCPSGTQGMDLAARKMSRLGARRRGTLRTTIHGLFAVGHRYVRVRNPELQSMADVVVEVIDIEMDLSAGQILFAVIQADPSIDDAPAPEVITPVVTRPDVLPGYQEPAVTPTGRDVAYPLTGGETQIEIAAFSATLPNGTVKSLPADTVTGLDPLTTYGVFWREDVGYEVEASPALNHKASGSWVFVGWQSTEDGSGEYPTPPLPPPGSGGDGNVAQQPL